MYIYIYTISTVHFLYTVYSIYSYVLYIHVQCIYIYTYIIYTIGIHYMYDICIYVCMYVCIYIYICITHIIYAMCSKFFLYIYVDTIFILYIYILYIYIYTCILILYGMLYAIYFVRYTLKLPLNLDFLSAPLAVSRKRMALLCGAAVDFMAGHILES